MDKYIKPNQNMCAADLVNDLRNIIRKLAKFAFEQNKTKVSVTNNSEPDFKIWLVVLSFMTRKVCALYLGSTDYDYNIKDISFNLTFKEGSASESN
jgi:hypothetical protein